MEPVPTSSIPLLVLIDKAIITYEVFLEKNLRKFNSDSFFQHFRVPDLGPMKTDYQNNILYLGSLSVYIGFNIS